MIGTDSIIDHLGDCPGRNQPGKGIDSRNKLVKQGPEIYDICKITFVSKFKVQPISQE